MIEEDKVIEGEIFKAYCKENGYTLEMQLGYEDDIKATQSYRFFCLEKSVVELKAEIKSEWNNAVSAVRKTLGLDK